MLRGLAMNEAIDPCNTAIKLRPGKKEEAKAEMGREYTGERLALRVEQPAIFSDCRKWRYHPTSLFTKQYPQGFVPTLVPFVLKTVIAYDAS